MNIEKEQNLVKEYLELVDKYLAEGNREKARECLKKIDELNNERWQHEIAEIKKLCEQVGVCYEDLQKE